MRETVGPEMGVKASGGVRTYDDAVAMLKALGLEGKRLTIIVRDEDVNAYLSFRNIPKTFIITADEANTYDLVNNNAVLMPADIAAHFGEVLA